MFKNQSIYIRCHKSFSINLGEGTLFRLRRLYLFSFLGGRFEPSGWLSTDVTAFKILQSCLYKRSLMETGKETRRRLWQRSKKCCMIFKSDSDAPYREGHYSVHLYGVSLFLLLFSSTVQVCKVSSIQKQSFKTAYCSAKV